MADPTGLGRGQEQAVSPSNPVEIEAAGQANNALQERTREERRRAFRYTAGAAAFVGALVALYHATSHRGTSALAGLLAPAAIMVLYLLWVLYTTRANRHAARLAAAAAAVASEQNSSNQTGNSTITIPTLESGTNLEPSHRSLPRAHSKLTLNTNGTLDPSPNRLRPTGIGLHHSTESLYRGGSHRAINNLAVNPAPVHRSTANLMAIGGSNSRRNLNSQRQGGSRMMRSTMQLNNTRQVAAASANLPSYEEATNRNHWLLTHTHSREKLLQRP